VRAAADDLLTIGGRLASGGAGRVRGLLVQPMAPPGAELIAGIQRDPQFGPVVIVGLGGILAEVLDDISLRLAPVSTEEALAMLVELRGAAVLDGVRGGPAVDREAVAALLVTLGRLAVARPDVREVDLNPVIAGARGALAVDALVVLDAAE
jgi:acetyltransferase